MDGESQSLSGHRSESKILVGHKRGIVDVEETSDCSQKRGKMCDLESVFSSEGRGHAQFNSRPLDLNTNVGSINCTAGDDAPFIDESKNLKEEEHSDGLTKTREFDLDLNADDISSSINDPFYPYKNYDHLKSRDDLECGSSVGPLDQKDSMRAWKGLKQNNYISNLYRNVPVPIPKPRGRKKSNNDAMKKKIELAKKEQVDRFARFAAPTGLLNGLNPGIINHVRNSKQVHSIIEALVRSERNEKNQVCGNKKFDQSKNGEQELGDGYAFFSKAMYLNTKVVRGDSDSYVGPMRIFSKMPSHCKVENEDDGLALKLASSVAAGSENTSCLSNDESAVNSLSFKAANVASQWLELLNQDIKGRLAALRRSKKRVWAVITTELPLLMSREFSSNPEKDPYTKKGFPDQATTDAHAVRWSAIFAQMDKALSEEEDHLESWLNQVKEMQLHCEKGLCKNDSLHAPQTVPIGNDSRPGAADNSEKDLAVRAAAASIYSTCDFLSSMQNLPCC